MNVHSSFDYQNLGAIRVRAQREVATSSADHRIPWGTRRDNSRNRRFNQKLYKLFAPQKGPLRVLDLGCSGGGFVKDCLDDGCIAVGLEGSDFSKKFRRAEWRTIPEFLFTSDITAPFHIEGEFHGSFSAIRFDVITSWEVMEHIADADLPQVVKNVLEHLEEGGLWIMSVSPHPDIVEGVNLHQTIQGKEWWVQRLAGLGVEHQEKYVRFFNTQFIRGPKYNAPGSFHLIVTRGGKGPEIPAENLCIKAYDRWLGCRGQKILKLALLGV